MSDSHLYIAANDAERARLNALVARLSDDDLRKPVNEYWTVAGVLAHIAFWDGRALSLLNKWESGRAAPSTKDFEPEDVDWINDGSRPLILAIPPRTAAELTVSIAEETDRRVAALSAEMLAAIYSVGTPPFNLFRAAHRGEHLDEIERALGA